MMGNCIENGLETGRMWFYYLPPDENQVRGQLDYYKDQGDKAPGKKPGDRYTIVGALVGVIAGFLLSIGTADILIIVLSTVGGGIVGTVIGSFIGRLIMKYQKSRRDRMKGV